MYEAVDGATPKVAEGLIEQGYLEQSNVNVVSEMVDMITASRAYEANVTTINAAKSMAQQALNISK